MSTRAKLPRLVIDLDGTVCSEVSYRKRQELGTRLRPIKSAVVTCNRLYREFYIIFYTARCWSEWRSTTRWLKHHKFKYDMLMCGKPQAEYFVDDRAVQFTSWKKVQRKINVPRRKNDGSHK